jgi:hypothetical protein
VCKTATTWNKTKMYDVRKANCQDFAEEILKSLGIDSKSLYDSAVGQFLTEIQSSYAPEKIANVSSKNSAKNSDIVFKFRDQTFSKHSDLDSKVLALQVLKHSFYSFFR